MVVLGVGNTLRSDDGIGPLLADKIKDRVDFKVINAGTTPENYLESIIKEKPDAVIIIDAVDFGASPGEFKALEGKELKTVNLFSTHNASLYLAINYLQTNLTADIIILAVQPKTTVFGDKMSRELEKTLAELELFFRGTKEKG